MESVERLIDGESSFTTHTLHDVLDYVDPDLVVDGEPLLLRVGIDQCNLDAVTRLLARGADPNKQGISGRPPLMAALERNVPRRKNSYSSEDIPACPATEQTVQALLQNHHHPAQVAIKYKGVTPLGVALFLEGGHFPDNARRSALVKMLLKAGADPNEEYQGEYISVSPLREACQSSGYDQGFDRESCIALVNAGADLSKDQYTLDNIIKKGIPLPAKPSTPF